MFPTIALGPFQISTFFMWMSLTWTVMLLVSFWLSKKTWPMPSPSSNQSSELIFQRQHHALQFFLIAMISSLVGSRLAHVIWEGQGYYWQNPIEIFYLWDGGFVFYGGAGLATLSAAVYARRHQLNFLEWADFFSPILALGYSLGRIGCFLAGCCYGKSCSLPWAIAERHPTAIYSSLWDLGVFFILLSQQKHASLVPTPSSSRTSAKTNRAAGKSFYLLLILHGLGRLWIEHYRDDFRGALLAGFTISQWLSLALISTGVFFYFKKSR